MLNMDRLTHLLAGQGVTSIHNPDNTKAHVILEFAPDATQGQKDAAAAILAAWNPLVDPDSDALADIQARWKVSVLHNKTPAEIYTLMQASIDGWTSLAQAKADLRVWLPALFAAVAWTAMKNSQRD